ncbi:hypothetical protein J4573_26760 [Actinomadura barringtoniae]|uniref:Histidine decarboxylase n=1 Tax=Actinomadura barringtoniae TaxID=1427535 RepID=A0A939PJ24_9ACTN|nr:pyridoxal-dependent decarboxylase [Actinomadura barringtoniae]MBO2450734.1 hypothetical protein [Actinomadura barringtoniae]
MTTEQLIQTDGPTGDPTDADFQISPAGMTHKARHAALDKLSAYYDRRAPRAMGYQVRQGLSEAQTLGRFLRHHINNAGDPFVDGRFTVHSRWLERAVLDYYARLWHASIPADRSNASDEDYWGYVLSMGSTEGNLYALWNARDYLDGNALVGDRITIGDGEVSRTTYTRASHPDDGPNAYTPVAFFSQDTHYSHLKGMNVLDIAAFYDMGADRYPGECPLTSPGTQTVAGWPVGVPSTGGDDGPGTIDIDALAALVDFFAAKGHPILVCFNVGSTFKGACDDVEGACARLRPIFEKHDLVRRKVHYDPADPNVYDIRDGYWIHVDAALGGAYLPYVEKAHDLGQHPWRPPVFDFRVPEVASIVTSGHKYPGAPFPTGVYLSKIGRQISPPNDPAVIASPDTTFAGSRSGLAAIAMWNHLARRSEVDHITEIVSALRLADYAADRLRDLGPHLEVGHTPNSLSVWFRQPAEQVVDAYCLACVPLNVNGVQRDFSHIYLMPHVTQQVIDEFVAALKADGYPAGAAGRKCV